ncbi:hypothetical protein dqs_3164 [Azoarcus olearius]|uniref:hypothetical protein n=1 Tax=Azoarcus sp. (strain BH72) TaxID=418699 RepID=UPI0008062156|nr:hypothetical protein [Azoarcus olearius]ANQ86192.1 hypothetical protein dqs_3164 [Azoarcus olearius]
MQTARIALLLAALGGLGVGAARALVEHAEPPPPGSAGDGAHSVMNTVAAAAFAGFDAAACAPAESPPAELLALADWPLDRAGTCTRAKTGADVAALETVAPIRAVVEVIEAEFRRPQDILDSYGDAGPTVAARGHDYGEHGALADTATAEAEAPYGDAGTLHAGELRPVPHVVRPPAAGRPLRPTLMAAAVDEATLDTLRGGFETPSGLRVSFGIERAVYVNGVLASVTTVNLAELGNLVGRGVALNEGATVAVIQNGPNGLLSSTGLANGALATVIQNSLDNQSMRAITTINATVNSMEMLRSGQMQQSVRDAMVHSLMR